MSDLERKRLESERTLPRKGLQPATPPAKAKLKYTLYMYVCFWFPDPT